MVIFTVTRKFPVNSNGWHGEVDVQLSPFGLLLLSHPLNSSEQHTRADLEFSSDFEENLATTLVQPPCKYNDGKKGSKNTYARFKMKDFLPMFLTCKVENTSEDILDSTPSV